MRRSTGDLRSEDGSGLGERSAPRAHEAEEEAGHLPHLDLLAALGDPVAAVVAVGRH